MASRPRPFDDGLTPRAAAAHRADLEPIVRRMFIDAMTADLVGAFEAEGIPCILLKGPAVVRWLYRPHEERSYLDLDLLVPESQLARAERFLEGRSFRRFGRETIPGDWPRHAHNWISPQGAVLDLHYTLPGAGASPREVWDILSPQVDSMVVADRSVDVLGTGARALLVAIHAYKDGAAPQVRRDLLLALERVPRGVWEEAARLAARLQAQDAFAVGLERVPAGRELARSLDLPADRSTAVALRARGAPPLAVGIDWLFRTPGWRGKPTLVLRKVFPPRAFLRDWTPLADRGPLGLAAAYVWRFVWVLWHAGPAYVAWRRARRETRRTES
jgi:hypothetical protein